jgi:hypothetical protein
VVKEYTKYINHHFFRKNMTKYTLLDLDKVSSNRYVATVMQRPHLVERILGAEKKVVKYYGNDDNWREVPMDMFERQDKEVIEYHVDGDVWNILRGKKGGPTSMEDILSGYVTRSTKPGKDPSSLD